MTGWPGKGVAVAAADIDARDWTGAPPQETLAILKDQLRALRGGIVLLHDTEPNTALLLPGLLAFLREEGFSLVRLTGPAPERGLQGPQAGEQIIGDFPAAGGVDVAGVPEVGVR